MEVAPMAVKTRKLELKFRTIKQGVLLPAPIEAVYEAWTDPKIHSEFTGAKAIGKPVKGGEFSAWDGYIFGKYKSLQKEKKLVMDWSTTEWPDSYPPSKLTLVFKENDRGTSITLLHEKVPASQVRDYAQGWKDFYWHPLRDYFSKK